MALSTRPLIAGIHAFFFADGAAFTVPEAGTAGRSSKPGAADAAWVDLGIIREGSITGDREAVEIFAPLPGRKRLYDVLETKAKLTVAMTLDEVSPKAVEWLFGSDTLTGASTQFNPLEGVTKKGWLKVQIYDEKDALTITVDLYVHIRVNGAVSLGDQQVSFPVEAMVLHSTLNTGAI